MAEIVVVTGGTAGAGRAIARRFAEEGAHVAVLARGGDRLDETQRKLAATAGRALALPCDVADADAVEEAAERVESELGAIDVWVNNAMTTIYAPAWEVAPDEFRRATEVTYLGTVWGTMAALRRMRPRNRGTIVQVGSALAHRGIPLQSPYCGAKHAVQGFTDSVRTELMHEKSDVHIASVHLPALNTPQFAWGRTRMPRSPQPVPPIFQPEVAADAVLHAVRKRRREMLVTFPTVQVVWANRVVPWIVDRYLARKGYEEQQTDEPVPPDRDDNLFDPVAGDFAAHGRFGSQAKERSILLALSKALASIRR